MTTIAFNGGEFRRLIIGNVSGVSEEDIADEASAAAREIYRKQSILRHVFTQTEAGGGRVFEAAHPGCDFGAVLGFYMPNADGTNTPATNPANVGERIPADSGEPLVQSLSTERRRQATRIYCNFFGKRGRGAGCKAVALVSLVLDDTATGIPDDVFREYRRLFQAAILKEFGGFLTEGKPNLEYWRMEYARHSDAAMERATPNLNEGNANPNFIGPADGGDDSVGYW